jgi:hypothetical protein
VTVRDRVVLWVLATGFVSALLAWHHLGRWPALAVGLIALGIACLAYRIEAPRVDVEHPEGWEHRGTERSERIDQ